MKRLIAVIFASTFALAACEDEEEPLEEAGEEIEEAGDEMEEAADDATDGR